MDISAFGPIAAVLEAAAHVVSFFIALFFPVLGSSAAAAAIIALTVLVRIMLLPVGLSQARAERTRARIAPKVAALRARHRGDPARLQREIARLYADEKTSPLAGCLPLVAQAPVLSIVYALFLHGNIAGHANRLLGHQLAGVPLGTRFVAAPDVSALVVIGTVLALLALVIAVSRRVLAAATIGERSGSGLSRAASYLPFATVAFAAFVPLAAALYLLTTTGYTVVERVVLRRVLARRAGT